MVVNSDGNFNTELSRTPSLMMIDLDTLNTETDAMEKQMEELERERLNKMQRRMQSGPSAHFSCNFLLLFDYCRIFLIFMF